MLYDPRWARSPKKSFSEPSLEGFALFVAVQMLRDPNGEYDWANNWDCAGGQYMRSLGLWSRHWNDKLEYARFEALACGKRVRDRRGRFTDDLSKGVWRWRDLHRRVQQHLREAKKWAAEIVAEIA